MLRSGVAFVAAFLFLVSLTGPIGVSADQTHKPDNPKAVDLSRLFRDRLASRPKASAAKSTRPRVDASNPAAPNVRALQFSGRAATPSVNRSDAAKSRPWISDRTPHVTLAETATARRGVPFEGRNGTGLGDIFEDEPNDSAAEVLDDLPVNVVGEISVNDDVDYFAITATQGESVRIEVVADRVFGSLLDSYLVVLDEDGETILAENDDFFQNSRDSFIRFVAPNSGERLYFIGVTDLTGLGSSSFDYVLNVTLARAPDAVEVEPNDTTPLADVLSTPSLVFGTANTADDLDVYIFSGVAGQTVILDVDAELFLSDMDSVVEIYDDRGGFLFGNDDTDGIDSRFNLLLPYTGDYYIAVYNRFAIGGPTYYYALNLSTQSGALAPRITGFKLVNGTFLKKVLGNGFDPTSDGAFAEINGDAVSSDNAPRKPTTVVRLRPAQQIFTNDIVTVVNPDGRRSNPGVVR